MYRCHLQPVVSWN